MIRDILKIVSLIGLMVVINISGIGSFFNLGEYSAWAFGFILLVSFLAGRVTHRAKMPMMTGYLVVGFLLGPYLSGDIWPSLRLLTPEVLEELSVFSSMALGLIAFTAGGELKIDSLRPRLRSILPVTAGQILITFSGVLALVLFAGPLFAVFGGSPFPTLLGIGLLLAVVAVANSPSTAIAIIVETKARGPMTTTVLGVTVLKDVLVVMGFSLALIGAKYLFASDAQPGWGYVLLILWEIVGSVGIGFFLGFLMGQYMRRMGREMPLILLALSFLAVELAQDFHLSGLLICLFAGFFVVNRTSQGELLVKAVERYSLPVFVLFFTLTGAELRVSEIAFLWPLVTALVVIRLAGTWLGTRAGAAFAGDAPKVKRHLWSGFVAQAGVSLGFANLIESQIPGLGLQIKSIIFSTVAVNQFIGPILFRLGLIRSGEASEDD